MTEEKLRLNLGAGPNPMPGYVNLDIKDGCEIGSLPYDDGTVDEIRASHVLEHVPFTRTLDVLKHWYAKLKPDGLVKIAVPDLQYIVERLGQATDEPLEGYLMGGHADEHDAHHAVFSEDKLYGQLSAAGFDSIERWDSDWKDCSSLPVSLNMQARKPAGGSMVDVAMLMSMYRLAFTANMLSTLKTVHELHTPIIASTGAFWGQCLERIMEQTLREMPNLKYVLTIDYDTVYKADQVRILRRLADENGCDAIFPVQAKRDAAHAMQTVISDDGTQKLALSYEEVRKPLLRCRTGHFGLTLLRVDAIKRLPKPWFKEVPDPNGGWGDGHIDPDIWFWNQWHDAGLSLWQANRVRVGHAQQVVTWPDQKWQSRHQFMNDWTENGIPDWAR